MAKVGVRRALLLTSGERCMSLVLNFATIAVVSRLLTPTEVGVAAIGWAILSIPHALRDLGIADFLVQRRQLTATETRTAVTIGVLAAMTLTGLILLASPSIGRLCGDVRIAEFISVMVLAVVTDAVANPLVALMRRDMAFRQVALVNIALAVATASATIGLAFAGFSYMSVAWAAVLGNIAAAACAICLRPEFGVYRPSLHNWQEVVGFGSTYSLMAAVMRGYEAVPYLALGSFNGRQAAGYYSRALQACQLPEKVLMAGISSVAFPALAAQARETGQLKSSYLRAVELISGVHWPALVLLACLAPRVVELLFGGQWADIVPMVQLMALASMMSVAGMLTYPALYATGELRQLSQMMALSLPLSALAIVVASVFGPYVLAMSLFFTIPFNSCVSLMFICRLLDISLQELLASIGRSVVVCAASATGPLLIVVTNGAHFNQPLTLQAAMCATAFVGWVAGLALSRHPLGAEFMIAYAAIWTLRGRKAAIDVGRVQMAVVADQPRETTASGG